MLIVWMACALAGLARGQGAGEVPRVALCRVAPDVLAVTVDVGRRVPGEQVPYVPLEGDQMQRWGNFETWGWVVRDGRIIGGRVGKRGDLMQTFDRVAGEPLDMVWAADPGQFEVSSVDDEAYAAARAAVACHRKSKPTDTARTGPWEFAAPVRHVLYLQLPEALEVGRHYRLRFVGGQLPALEFTADDTRMVSEAIHVTQVGFRPDDPVKLAYLSCWMGTGGGQKYGAGIRFRVVGAGAAREVAAGEARLVRAVEEPEDVYDRNYNGTDVWALDFGTVSEPGRYRVIVEGVGCSEIFEISEECWRAAFEVSAKGLYHQRSGIELGPPHTSYRRPRCFHPDDGVQVYASTCSLMDSGNGLNAKGTDKDNFGNLVAGRTDEVVADAWGGYCDAGDWDRRIQHLEATRLLLELVELHPAFCEGVELAIPETGNGLPDLVNEAMWGLDCYRRMQLPNGAIRGGIESAEHPLFGEGSWQESLPVMAYAPDLWSSFVYAGDAARLAVVLGSYRPELAAVYRESALRAAAWAESEWARLAGEKLPTEVRDARNLAALELYRLTGDAAWHRVFLESTVFGDAGVEVYEWTKHDQRDAAFLYARLEGLEQDAGVRANCRAALLRAAAMSAELSERTGFGWTKSLNVWQPASWGVLGAPQAVGLVRAHWLSGDGRYLEAALRACQYGAGANPMNLCMTTGVGHAWPEHALVVDARISHQDPPPGITVLGPKDTKGTEDHFLLRPLRATFEPPPEQWPTTEAYFDLFWYPEVNEFTVNATMGPNAYVWGYLAAR